MRRTAIKLLTVCAALTVSGELAAEDALQREGTPREQHAQAIFAGVFGQCRAQVAPQTTGLVAIVFSVGEDGRFGATSTLDGDRDRSALRALAQCMGERANRARPFPKTGDKTIVGVKYELKPDGKMLMLGAGEARTLRDGDVFTWARQRPTDVNS